MVFTICLYSLIAIAVCLYLYIDGKHLCKDLCSALAFTVLLLYMTFVFSVTVIAVTIAAVIGPILRLVFRVDTVKITNKIVPLAMSMLKLKFLDKIREAQAAELAKEKRIKRGYHARRN